MPNNNQPHQQNKRPNENQMEQNRQSQRMEEGQRTGKADVNEDKRYQNNPQQPQR